jgi:hypothetical protein
MGVRSGHMRCYACSPTDQRPEAALWLEAGGPEELHVSNIAPRAKRVLSEDEHNLILAEFASDVLQPAIAGVSVEILLGRRRIGLDAFLSPEAIRRLEAFAAAANKNALPTADDQRWREFVIQTHLEHAGLDPLLLEEWLAERGWSEAQRRSLACEYESTRSVLADYDAQRLDVEKCLP